MIIAVIVQPTIGTISDYTISRLGSPQAVHLHRLGARRRVPGRHGHFEQDLLAIAAFVVLLQFSSNFAQGPFQGYVPDLVPAPQVGLASALVGLMQILGNVAGIAGRRRSPSRSASSRSRPIALGVLELVTMLGGRSSASTRAARRATAAAGRWRVDRRRGVGHRHPPASAASCSSSHRGFAILMAGAVLINLALFYLGGARADGPGGRGGSWLEHRDALVALGTLVAIIPAARLSDRVGRKRVIYAACAIGALGHGHRAPWPRPCRWSSLGAVLTASAPGSSWPSTGRS